MPQRRIHTNDLATIGPEVGGDGAHHGTAQGSHTGAGAAVPARYAAGEGRDSGSVGATHRPHAQSRQLVAALLGSHRVQLPGRSTGQDRGRHPAPATPQPAVLQPGGVSCVEASLGVVRRDVRQAPGGGAASPVAGAGEVRGAEPGTAGARQAAAHQRCHHRPVAARGETQAAAPRTLPHQAQHPPDASDPRSAPSPSGRMPSPARWAPTWWVTTAATAAASTPSPWW